ncbi:MAG TPA: GntR family transcriptional regulator [Diaminobutyricibacter sp.]
MQIEIDPLSTTPIYQQIRDRVVEAVAGGDLAPGDQLSSVRQLAVDFGINVATVAKAYDVLRNEGIIRTNHKSGSVIARGPGTDPADDAFVSDWSARLATLLAEAIAAGLADSEIVAHSTAIVEDFSARRSRSHQDPAKDRTS